MGTIAEEASRILGLRNNIRTKLNSLGVISSTTATL